MFSCKSLQLWVYHLLWHINSPAGQDLVSVWGLSAGNYFKLPVGERQPLLKQKYFTNVFILITVDETTSSAKNRPESTFEQEPLFIASCGFIRCTLAQCGGDERFEYMKGCGTEGRAGHPLIGRMLILSLQMTPLCSLVCECVYDWGTCLMYILKSPEWMGVNGWLWVVVFCA